MNTCRTITLFSLLLLAHGCGGYRSHMQRGEAFLAKDNGKSAIRMYEQALAARPGNPKATLGMARAMILAGEPAGAIGLAQKAVEAEVDGAPAVLAEAHIESGMGSQALPVIEQGLQDDPNNPTLHLLQAEAWMAQRDLDKALAAATRAFDIGGGAPAASLMAWIHVRQGDCSPARALATRASASHFGNGRVQAEAASVFRLCGQSSSLKSTATTARALVHDRGATWIDSAILRGNGEDQEGALRKVSWVRAIFPDDGMVAREMGNLWAHLDEPGRAIQELELALTLPPYTTETRKGVQLAIENSTNMDSDDRRAAIEEIWTAIIQIHESRNNRVGVAEAIGSQIAARRDQAPEDYLRLSDAWEFAGSQEKALEAAVKAIKKDSSHIAARTRCAILYATMGDLEAAVGHARLAWSQNTADLQLTILLGELHLARDNRREARRVFGVGLGHHPDNERLQKGMRRAQGYGR